MDDFNWIKQVSNNKVIVLRFLMELRIPSNLNNAFHKRRDLLSDYLIQVDNLEFSTNDGTVENYVIVKLKKKLMYTLELAENYGPSGCRDKGRYGQGKHVSNALKGIKKTIKEGMESIGSGDDSLWWLENDDSGYRTYRGGYTYKYRDGNEDKWWKKYTGESKKTF
jgi:hypothetical protein